MSNSKQTPASAKIHTGPGFRVGQNVEPSKFDVKKMFGEFAVSDISDQLNRLYGLESAIRCLSGHETRLIGPACTVKVFPGDNLMVHKALDVARPGDVVVVDAGGSMRNAVLGDIISTKSRHRGIAGFVIDGCVRDLNAIQSLEFPVYARGETLIGPLHRGPGEINYPICCGGVVVEPGDIIVADVCGVVVVPRDHIEIMHTRLQAFKSGSSDYLAAVRRGEFSNAWVDQQLEAAQCQFGDRENAPAKR